MAGRGSRFRSTSEDLPKALAPVFGKTMLWWALRSVLDIPHSEILFVVLAEHSQRFQLDDYLVKLDTSAPCSIVTLPEVTEGQLCTVLACRDQIATSEDLLVASSDTYVLSKLASAIKRRSRGCAGIISVADMPGESWSFARTDDRGTVVEVAEKERVSNHASTGLYYFSDGSVFVDMAERLLRRGEKTRGEYYVAPLYRDYIARRWRVEIDVAREMWDMGTPEAKEGFESHLASLASAR